VIRNPTVYLTNKVILGIVSIDQVFADSPIFVETGIYKNSFIKDPIVGNKDVIIGCLNGNRRAAIQ